MSGATGSLFPLFPWTGYLLLGGGVGALYASSERRSRFAQGLALAGLGLAVGGFQLQEMGMRLYASLDFWHTSPTLFATRAGVVLLVLGSALQFKALPASAAGKVRVLAQESLLVYALHVCLLYGSVWNPGLRQYWGGSLALPQAAAGAGLMIAAVLLMALAWNRCKTAVKSPMAALRSWAAAVAAAASQRWLPAGWWGARPGSESGWD